MTDITERLRHGVYGINRIALCSEAADAIESRDATIAELRAQVEALRADAERLDFIAGRARCDPKMDGQHVWWPTNFNHRLTGPTLRAAIDAARSQEDKG